MYTVRSRFIIPQAYRITIRADGEVVEEYDSQDRAEYWETLAKIYDWEIDISKNVVGVGWITWNADLSRTLREASLN